MPPAPEWTMRARTSSVPSLSSAATIASIEPCTSPLMTSGNSLRPLVCELRHHLLERAALAGLAGHRLVAGQALAVFGDLAGARLVVDDGEAVAGLRRALQAEHLDRHGGRRFLDLLAAVVDQRAHAAPLVAGDDDVAGHQRAGLHQHGGDRAAALVELGLDDDAFGGAVRIGLEVEDFGLQQDRLEQLVEIGALGGGDLDVEHLAAHRLRRRPRAAGARVRTFCGSACGLSILLIATMIGTPAALAWLIDSIVCGITLSSAATTRMAMSVACAPRARIAVKAAWPGVSMKVIFWPFFST